MDGDEREKTSCGSCLVECDSGPPLKIPGLREVPPLWIDALPHSLLSQLEEGCVAPTPMKSVEADQPRSL